MRRAIIGVVLATLLGCTAEDKPAAVTEEQPGGTAETKPAGTAETKPAGTAETKPAGTTFDDPLVDAGKAALRSLTRLGPGEKHASYFKVMQGPDNVLGFVIDLLEARGSGDELVYRYDMEFGVTFPNGGRLKAVTNATLRPNFEPIDIRVARTTIDPRGQRKVVLRRATLESDSVKLSAEAQGEVVTDEVLMPARPLIYAIELFVQHLDIHKHDHFTVGEFDIYTGGAGPLTFKTETWNDGTPTVLTMNDAGGQSYQFWFDKENKLVRWGEPSLPVLFVRSTKGQVQQLKLRFE